MRLQVRALRGAVLDGTAAPPYAFPMEAEPHPVWAAAFAALLGLALTALAANAILP